MRQDLHQDNWKLFHIIEHSLEGGCDASRKEGSDEMLDNQKMTKIQYSCVEQSRLTEMVVVRNWKKAEAEFELEKEK